MFIFYVHTNWTKPSKQLQIRYMKQNSHFWWWEGMGLSITYRDSSSCGVSWQSSSEVTGATLIYARWGSCIVSKIPFWYPSEAPGFYKICLFSSHSFSDRSATAGSFKSHLFMLDETTVYDSDVTFINTSPAAAVTQFRTNPSLLNFCLLDHESKKLTDRLLSYQIQLWFIVRFP